MLYTQKEMLTILKLKDEEESIDIGSIRTVILQRPSNMIYCETNGKLTGVISMGDLLRACRKNQNQVIVNKQFTSIQYGKFIEAKNIFGSAKNINALPIITEKNTLVGDYTRWDDLLVLEYLIQADNGRCIEEWGEGRKIVLVRPNKLFRMRQKIFEEFKKYLGKHQAKFQCIEITEVSAFLKKTDLILFVDENEIRACKTALYLLHRESSAHYKMKTYRNILNDNLGFGDEECALYLKKLRNKGVRILGLRFEESAYSRQLLKEIELRYERERAALCATLPEVMHQEFFGELYNEEYASGILNRPLDYENNGGVYSLKDCRSQYYNIVNGERCTENQPEYYEKSIYFFGPCYIYGHYVEDKNTIESMIQKKICSHGRNVRVVNCGSMGTDIEYRYLFSDIVMLLSIMERALICLTILYHIQGSISLSDCVHRINHFFKLLTLNLNTVSVHHYPVRDGIFFCQFPQLAFSDTEIFCCFFYGKSVLFPNRHVVIVQFVVPLS